MKSIDDKNIKESILDCNKKVAPSLDTFLGTYLDTLILFNISKQTGLNDINSSILFVFLGIICNGAYGYKLGKTFKNIPKNAFKNMDEMIKMLASKNIKVDKDILKRAFIYEKETVDGKRKLIRDNIYFVDKENCLRVLQKKVLLKKKMFSSRVRYEKLYLLNSKEMKEEIENLSLDEYKRLYRYLEFGFDNSDSHYISLLNKRQRQHLKEWYKKKSRSTLIGLALLLGLSYINLKRDYGNIENALNNSKIMSYFEDSDSLNEKAIEELLKDINEDIRKITDDRKFNIDEVDTTREIESYFLLNAINSNENMTKKEKELYLNFYDFYLDDPYLDNASLYERLQSLEFIREDEVSEEELESTKTKEGDIVIVTDAVYYDFDNRIVYYYKPVDDTIVHEGVHCNLNAFNIPLSLKEGMAEIIKTEYFDYDNFSYYRNTSLTKALIEIVGKDTILKSISLDDLSYLKKALINNLIKNGKNEDNAKKIVSDFLKEINISFSDTNIGNYTAHKINLKQFYVYDERNDESIERFEKLVDDFYYGYYPDNDYCYFNNDSGKRLVKH